MTITLIRIGDGKFAGIAAINHETNTDFFRRMKKTLSKFEGLSLLRKWFGR